MSALTNAWKRQVVERYNVVLENKLDEAASEAEDQVGAEFGIDPTDIAEWAEAYAQGRLSE